MSHIWISHVIHIHESCHTYEWVMSHIWISHVIHIHESCHTYAWVMSHIYMSHVIHIHESCHTYAWVMSRIYMSHVIYTEWVTSTFYHVTHMNRSYPTHQPRHTSKRGWLVNGVTPDISIWWHTYTWVMAHIYMRRVSHTYEMSHVDIIPCHTCAGVMSHIWMMSHMCMSHVPHMHQSCHTYTWVTTHIYISHVTHMKWVTLTSYHVAHLNTWHEPCHTSNRGRFCDWGHAPDFQRPVRVVRRWGFALCCSLRGGDRQTEGGR